ncbi:MAG: hypothetical protein SV377_00340 [Halobacteria archaeon]|nr:hypothetical protein [Halobacteria archaeon]
MHGSLFGFLIVGWVEGRAGLLVNSAMSLAILYLPAILERDYEIYMDTRLTLWITSAVFLHAVGALGVYKQVWWYDHVTHTLSSTVVAGAGYATVRAIDEHTDSVHLPRQFIFVFILLFVLAFGVLWEVLEFGIGYASQEFGTARILTQYGVEDTMMDLLFNTLGGIIVAVWGTAYLTDLTGSIRRRLEDQSA